MGFREVKAILRKSEICNKSFRYRCGRSKKGGIVTTQVNPVSANLVFNSFLTKKEGSTPKSLDSIDQLISDQNYQEAIDLCQEVIENDPDSIQAIWASILIEILNFEDLRFDPIKSFKQWGLEIKTYTYYAGEFSLIFEEGKLLTIIPGKISIKGNKLEVDEYAGGYKLKVIFKNFHQRIEQNNIILKTIVNEIPTELFNEVEVIEFGTLWNLVAAATYEFEKQKITCTKNATFGVLVHELMHHWDRHLTKGPNDLSKIF